MRVCTKREPRYVRKWFGVGLKASLAQLEERRSHNPKVVSSILTTRSFFLSFFFCMEAKRDLGTVILTKSITKKGELVGKILEDGNSVETNGTTYTRFVFCSAVMFSVNSWINSVMYDSHDLSNDYMDDN